MSALLTRLVLYLFLPATLGGALAWATRSGPAAQRSQPSPTPPRPGALGRAAFGKNESAPAADSSLSVQRAFCERLRGATLAQMRDMLAETQRYADQFTRESSQNLIIEQMVRTDPRGAWALLPQEGPDHDRISWIFLQTWGRIDVEAALAWADTQGARGPGYASVLASGLLPEKAETFLKLLPRLGPDCPADGQIPAAFEHIATRDPARARQLLAGLPAGSRRNFGLTALAEGWASRDPAAARAWAGEFTDPGERESALRGILRGWARTDPQAAAEKIGELSRDSSVRREARGNTPEEAIVRAWAAQDPMAAAAWLRGLCSSSAGCGSAQLLLTSEILPSRDSWSAAELMELTRRPEDSRADGPGQKPGSSVSICRDDAGDAFSFDDSSGNGVGLGFGGQGSLPGEPAPVVRLEDPAGQFDALAGQPPDAARQRVLSEAAIQWVAGDTPSALARLRQSGDEQMKSALVSALANSAVQKADFALASEVAGTLPADSPLRQSILCETGKNIALRDPERALSLLDGPLEPGARTAITTTLAAGRAGYDPAGAMTWAASQDGEKMQTAAVQAVVSSWSAADSAGASGWLETQPPGPLREAAVTSFVEAVQTSDPGLALHWAATLTDPDQRDLMLMRTVEQTMWAGPDRARALAATLPLSDSARETIARIIDSQEQHRF